MSGACDSSDFDANTILTGSEIEYVFTSGSEIIKFFREDKIIDFISLKGNNMIPAAIAIGEKTHIWNLTNTNILGKKELKRQLH